MSKNYVYFNPNPTVRFDKKTGKPKRWTKGDCVIRAFCGVLDKDWDEVFSDLCAIGLKLHEMPNAQKVIDTYAKNNNMVKISLPAYITVTKFASKYSGVCIANIHSHVVCIKNKKINDCWDCGDYKMKTYYELKK